MNNQREPQVISFKADKALLEALEGITNRSEFIRSAILMALENICPLCGGSGLLSASQKNHLDTFLKYHEIVICKDCNQRHLTCSKINNK